MWISVIRKYGDAPFKIFGSQLDSAASIPVRALIITLCFAFLFGWPVPRQALADSAFFSQARAGIESLVQAESSRRGFMCRGELICGLQVIPSFYRNRGYAPVWFDSNGLRPAVRTLIDAIRQADREGLLPSEYHLATAEALLADLSARPYPPDESMATAWADFDLILTDAFLLLGSHLSAGRINPETLHADWLTNNRSVDLLTLMEKAVCEDQIKSTLAQLRPEHKGYTGLVAALQKMRDMDALGGWPRVEYNGSLRPGDRSETTATLRERLLISGDLPNAPDEDQPPVESDLYDESLVAAVRHFQQCHGLETDGVVGPHTLKALNVSTAQRARQIELNLERWRWLPHDLGERYIEINTADFNLQVVEAQKKVLGMRVVVGRPARRTPVFSTTMSYLVLNPYWTVPRTIAVEDILPKLAEGIDYLIRQNIKVYADWAEGAPEIDPRSVEWQQYSKAYFPLTLRQEPGDGNALGRIKFIFPNKFAVYLHDTPQRSLFDRVQRDFSSGCIRLENATALAIYLLSDDPEWTAGRLRRIFKKGERQVVRIPRPITVHLLYMTAWVDENGELQFRRDIYGRDRDLNAALLKRAPYLLPAAQTD